MKIKWMIQDVNMRESQLKRKFDALQSLREEMHPIGVMKHYDYITGLSEAIGEDIESEYVFLSGVKVLNILKKAKTISDVIEKPTDFQLEHGDLLLKKLVNGLFYDFINFDQKNYGLKNLPLLNSESMYLPLKDNMDTVFNEDKFIKPTRDLKAFDAAILKAGKTMNDLLKTVSRQRFYMEEDIVVAPLKKMKNEYRFFVIDDVVVAGSAYRVDGIAMVSEDVSDEVWEAAHKYAKLYKPNDVYTMDLALLEDDTISIIEYNCFNCSGVYLCDLEKTYIALRQFKEKRGF